MKMLKTPINAVPPDDWRIPVTAPALPEVFTPQSMRFGHPSPQFDQDNEPPGTHRHAGKARQKGEPYADTSVGGTPQGDRDTEAALRYEDHARLRMKARREKLDGNDGNDGKAMMEDDLSTATPEYLEWRKQEIQAQLAATCDTHATDHSTILTNPRHAEKALAYDVAIGVGHIGEEAMRELRVIADWRLLKELEKRGNSNRIFLEYFKLGLFKKSRYWSGFEVMAAQGECLPKLWMNVCTSARRHPDVQLDCYSSAQAGLEHLCFQSCVGYCTLVGIACPASRRSS